MRERVGVIDLGGFTKLLIEGRWRGGVAGQADLRQAAEAGPDRALLCAERQGRHRQRVHDHAAGREPLLPRQCGCWRNGTTRLAGAAPAEGRRAADREPLRAATARSSSPARRRARCCSRSRTPISSNAAFPWLSAREIEIGYRARSWRCASTMSASWAGSCTCRMRAVWRRSTTPLWQAGETHGIRDFGIYAMDTMRLEKCYRGWKGDLTHEYTPFMAGLDRFVDAHQERVHRPRRAAEGAQQRPEGDASCRSLLEDAGTADALVLLVGLAGRRRSSASSAPAATATASARALRSPMSGPTWPSSARPRRGNLRPAPGRGGRGRAALRSENARLKS